MNDHSHLTLRVYSAIPRQDAGEEWLNIGVAFPHQDGKGFDVVLQALPLNPRLVLRDSSHEQGRPADPSQPAAHREPRKPPSLRQQLEAFERVLIEQTLMETGGNIGAVMQRLNIPRRTLSEKMARLGIDRRRFSNGARKKFQ